MEDNRTFAELAQEVIEVQSAWDLSGVLRSAHLAMCRLRQLSPGAPTEALNRHPIAQAWAVAVLELAEIPISVEYDDCLETVEAIAQGETP